KSQVLDEGEMTSIKKIHIGARLDGDIIFKNHHLTLDKAVMRTMTRTTTENSDSWIVECDKNNVNVRKGKHCILNATGAPAADHFLCLDANEASNEVSQSKLYETTRINQQLYNEEREKAASEDDFFILLTTQERCDIRLPKNSGIVDKQNWLDYF